MIIMTTITKYNAIKTVFKHLKKKIKVLKTHHKIQYCTNLAKQMFCVYYKNVNRKLINANYLYGIRQFKK